MPPSSGKIANVATITPRVRSTNVLTWELARSIGLPRTTRRQNDSIYRGITVSANRDGYCVVCQTF